MGSLTDSDVPLWMGKRVEDLTREELEQAFIAVCWELRRLQALPIDYTALAVQRMKSGASAHG